MDEDFDGLKSGDISRLNIPWYQKLLLKISPRLFLKFMAGKSKVDFDDVDDAFKIFEGKKIHIKPLTGATGRGFIIFIDNKLSLWFYQDGDHFKFDGFEMGEYDNGEVSVFDGISR